MAFTLGIIKGSPVLNPCYPIIQAGSSVLRVIRRAVIWKAPIAPPAHTAPTSNLTGHHLAGTHLHIPAHRLNHAPAHHASVYGPPLPKAASLCTKLPGHALPNGPLSTEKGAAVGKAAKSLLAKAADSGTEALSNGYEQFGAAFFNNAGGGANLAGLTGATGAAAAAGASSFFGFGAAGVGGFAQGAILAAGLATASVGAAYTTAALTAPAQTTASPAASTNASGTAASVFVPRLEALATPAAPTFTITPLSARHDAASAAGSNTQAVTTSLTSVDTAAPTTSNTGAGDTGKGSTSSASNGSASTSSASTGTGSTGTGSTGTGSTGTGSTGTGSTGTASTGAASNGSGATSTDGTSAAGTGATGSGGTGSGGTGSGGTGAAGDGTGGGTSTSNPILTLNTDSPNTLPDTDTADLHPSTTLALNDTINVPEPASLLVFAFGAGAAALVRRRR